jgi:hypothetical protein
MRSIVRIQPYVPREVASRLRAYAAAQGVPDGAVVSSALKEYLDRDRNDRELLMRRLDRNTVGIQDVRRDLAVVAEAVAALALAGFKVASPGATARDPAVARREAQIAYEQLLQHVSRRFMSPDGFMGRVLAEPHPSDSDE